jgi:ubiquinone/menaquinone biosynthesis C-methylase UbiE
MTIETLGIDIANNVFSAPWRRPERPDRAALVRMDALSLDFDYANFAAAYTVLALNFVSDPAKAAREMRRVVRPGGGGRDRVGLPRRARVPAAALGHGGGY